MSPAHHFLPSSLPLPTELIFIIAPRPSHPHLPYTHGCTNYAHTYTFIYSCLLHFGALWEALQENLQVKKWAACIDGLMRVSPILYTAGSWKIWWQCLSKGKGCDHPESEVYKTAWSLSRMDLAWGHQITYYLPPLNLRTMPSPLPCPCPTRWTGRQVDVSLWKELWDIFFSVSTIQYKVARKKKKKVYSECDTFFRDSEKACKNTHLYSLWARNKCKLGERMKNEVPQDGYEVQSRWCKQWFSTFCLCADHLQAG